jgi:NAD(P)-dependent dehydrogenase (short-subunit alcohol dehydrogenase family)
MIQDKFDLSGKVAVVTGGTKGIGKAISLALAEAGADVVPTSRTLEDVKKTVAEIESLGRASLAITTDVSKSDQVEGLIKAVVEKFGRVDILVNNAGISPYYKRAETVTEEEWDQVINVNLKGVFLCSQAAGRVMIEQKWGRIINIASIGAVVGLPKLVTYCASKGGIAQMTKVLAAEWARHNILVNCIAPAYTETEMTAGMRNSPQILEQLTGATPLGRLAKPEEIAGMAVFLASEAASFMTGQIVLVDGGWTAI